MIQYRGEKHMTEKSWKKRTAIAGIAAMLIVSGNLPINLVAEDNDNPAPDTTETITEENTAPDISDSETDSEDNTNTETTVSTEGTDSSLDQSSADESEAQNTNTLAGTSSEEDQAAAGIQIQYDESTTIHYVKDGNDTLILYCMNNKLHWPHTTDSISSVPTYSETTLEDFCKDIGVTYTSTLESKLKALLYAGYPYNGFDQYQIVDSSGNELTDEEFNELLNPPQYLREDFPNSLGETVFTLENSTSGDNYNKLKTFVSEAESYQNGKTTASGLTYEQIENTAFWKALSCLINFGASAKTAYIAFYVSGYYVTKEEAYDATSQSVWNLMSNNGVPDNESIKNLIPLASKLLISASTSYTLLDTEPTDRSISVNGDLSFYYNESDKKWHTNPITFSVPDNYNTSFTLVLPDGVKEESNQTLVSKNSKFSFVAGDPADITEVQLTADIPWIVGDLKVYEPEAIAASDEKGFQNMVGAVIRTKSISTKFQIAKKTSVTVKKVWDDNNNIAGKRASNVQAQLYADSTPYGSPVTLNADNSWTYTWGTLPINENGETITYSVKEVNVPKQYTSEVTGNASSGFTITNTFAPGTTSVNVTKAWNDSENQDGKRPNSVTVQLLADGKQYGDLVTLNSSGNWMYTWRGLPMYKDGGTPIQYTVQETSTLPDGYTSSITGSAESGYVITNSYTPKTTTITGVKTWDDGNNQDGKRPSQITVKLLADGIEADRTVAEADENGEWKYSFSNLPKFRNGKEISYSVIEDAVPDYSTQIDGFDIRNSYTPGKTSVTVTKVWDDGNNQDGIRPESVQVQLYADGKASGDPVTLNSDGN